MRAAISKLYETQKSLQLAIVIFLISGIVGSGMAASDSRQQRAKLGLSNFAYEVIECGSYYAIAADGLNRGEKFKAAQKATEVNKFLFSLARKITPQDTFFARLELVMNEQIDAVNGDYTNLSILIVRYHETCKFLVENIENRMEYHLEKALEE